MDIRPRLVSTWSFGRLGNEAAWPVLASGGSALEAVCSALEAVEMDPRVDSVGVGGIPDASGEVCLDAAVMLSPARWAAVCAVRSTGVPSAVCRALLDDFDRALRVGEGADAYAASRGIQRVEPWSEGSRAFWRVNAAQVRSVHDQQPFTIPIVDDVSGALFPVDERQWSRHDTIGVLALDGSGMLCAGTSTSGTPLKPVGRVGDSAIVGQGLYVLPGVGGAVATGTGEIIAGACLCHDVVGRMRESVGPASAVEGALRLLLSQSSLHPQEQVAVVCLSSDGRIGAGSVRPGFRVAVTSGAGTSLREPDCVLLDA